MSRTLTSVLAEFFSPGSRSRGDRYFRQGRVTITEANPPILVAHVDGSETYEIVLELDGQRLGASCTCSSLDASLDPCKHLWAALLAADSRRTFVVPSGLWLDLGDEVAPDDDDEIDQAVLWDSIEGAGEPELSEDPTSRPGRLTAVKRPAIADRMQRLWDAHRQRARSSPPAAPPAWQTLLTHVNAVQPAPAQPGFTGELVYVFDPVRSASIHGVQIELFRRERKQSGEWGPLKTLMLQRTALGHLPDPRDRRILETVCGADITSSAYAYAPVPSPFVLSPTLQRELVPRMCDTGRLLLSVASPGSTAAAERTCVPLRWIDEPAVYRVRITGNARDGYVVAGLIQRAGRELALTTALFMTSSLLLWPPEEPGATPAFGPFEVAGAEAWLRQALQLGEIVVPGTEAAALIEAFHRSDVQHLDVPEELRRIVRREAPRPIARIKRSNVRPGWNPPTNRLQVSVSFAYGPCETQAGERSPVLVDRATGEAWRRDREAEAAALDRLQPARIRRMPDWQTGAERFEVTESNFASAVRALLADGWQIEAEGALYRRPGVLSLEVRSGIDWFELHGGVEFDGIPVALPALLAAARRGETVIRLDDGTVGLLPEEWLARAGRIAAIGDAQHDHVRFTTPQALLLDAWLSTQPAVSHDEAFARARAELAAFDGIAPFDPPPSFAGELRHYQRDALGWFAFLRRFGCGGCLADEMGLGKTVMILAGLDARRAEAADGRHPHRPSLIVMPRSLVFNWRQEAARFAPKLRVLDFTGADRRELLEEVRHQDLVLTTYGTLRRDAGLLKEIEFDYVVLDEAQAIKNARTNAAKAVRLLKATHRLALSGTPIENHLGELWSLFEFLNPGMLGGASALGSVRGGGKAADDPTVPVLARGLRPFILRRTKEQVLAELPARTEQTLYCELEPVQRALYNQLRDHYRASLLGKVARIGLGRAQLQILEALLRLRQAACHPALVDPARMTDPSAKLDLLLPRLEELVEDGRKALIFSQFTSLLALLRARLDAAGMAYEYLDGRTRDREACVERFQTSGCPLFLVSLKAGGVGLNLTAAEDVFLLDPWWNPAVEAQAIDRAHRIGQTRPVFAWRLIARDTVEEKVVELQASKRELADAIIRADEGLIRNLRREDLEILLS